MGSAANAQETGRAHITHAADSFVDTPTMQGLLPTALAEAEIAARHAELAASDPSDLGAMQRHASHVLHALDPSAAAGGPGMGYGVRSGVTGARQHVELAAAADSASENVTTHARHITSALAAVMERTDEAVALARRVQSTSSATAAAPLARQLDALAHAILYGVDTNRDGVVGWQDREGGVRQATYHMNLMKRGEGLSP